MSPKRRKKPRKPSSQRMPQRPVQHVQEDRSRRAFEAALPDEWVFRPQSHDYGIDGEVEVFRDDWATGRIFKIQLKATSDPLSRALRVRLPNDKVEYYTALRLPVLVVRYHSPTKSVYGRWFHSFDPHYGGQNKKSISLVMGEADLLVNEKWDEIAADAEMFYRLRDPRSALPMEFEIVVPRTVRGASGEACTLGLMNAAVRFPDLMKVTKEAGHGRGIIRLSDETTAVTFRDVASATAHHVYDSVSTEPAAPGEVVADSMLSIALAFDRVGQTDAAARIAADSARNSSLISSPDVMFRVVGLFARSHRVSEAIALADEFASIGSSDADMVAALFLTPAMLRSAYLTGFEQDSVARHLQQRIASATQSGTQRDVGVAHYNLGNHLRSRGAWDEAAAHYALAAQHDSNYWARDYFAKEFAGALYHTGKFDLSAEMYGKAIALGNKGTTPALWADALMGAGKYRDAQIAFHDYNGKTGPAGEDEWRLKEWALQRIRTFGGDIQARGIEEAMRLSDVSDPALTDEDRAHKLRHALRTDALCAGAWFNLAVLQARQGNVSSAFEGFLISALIVPHDPAAWVRALVCSVESSDGDGLFTDIASCGYRWNRSTFLEQLAEALDQFDNAYPKEHILEAARKAIETVPADRDQGPVEVRMLGKGSHYESMLIPGPPE